MGRLPETIESARLVLRVWRVDEAPRLAAAVAENLEHLRPWMPWVAQEPLSVEARRDLIAEWRAAWDDGGDGFYGVFLNDGDETVIGSTGFHRRIGPGGLEIGYWIHRDHARRGYATELSDALTRTAFAQPGIDRVEIHHDKANVASAGVPAKLGFTKGPDRRDEITAPGEVGIDCTWTARRTQWTSPFGPQETG